MIFASDCPFCHEVLLGYEDAYYFNPFQPEELALLMERAIRGELAQKKMISKTNSHSSENQVQKMIGWECVLKEVLSVVER